MNILDRLFKKALKDNQRKALPGLSSGARAKRNAAYLFSLDGDEPFSTACQKR